MKKKKVYDLRRKLAVLFCAARQENATLCDEYLKNIIKNTGISLETLQYLILETVNRKETTAQLKYRIINAMQSRGLDTTFIV